MKVCFFANTNPPTWICFKLICMNSSNVPTRGTKKKALWNIPIFSSSFPSQPIMQWPVCSGDPQYSGSFVTSSDQRSSGSLQPSSPREHQVLYNCTTVQLFNCTNVQLYNFTTVQLYNCTTVQLSNCTTSQLYICTTLQLFISITLFYLASLLVAQYLRQARAITRLPSVSTSSQAWTRITDSWKFWFSHLQVAWTRNGPELLRLTQTAVTIIWNNRWPIKYNIDSILRIFNLCNTMNYWMFQQKRHLQSIATIITTILSIIRNSSYSHLKHDNIKTIQTTTVSFLKGYRNVSWSISWDRDKPAVFSVSKPVFGN